MGNDSISNATISAVWEAAGGNFDHKQLVADHRIPVSATWNAVDRMLAGRTRSDSGFRVTIGKAETLDHPLRMVVEFILENLQAIQDVRSSGVRNTVSLMFGLRMEEAFARVLTFPAEFLVRLASEDIDMEIIACLQSD